LTERRHRIGLAAKRGFLLGIPLMCVAAAWTAMDAERAHWRAFVASGRDGEFLAGGPLKDPYVHWRAMGRWERSEQELLRSGQRLTIWRATLDDRAVLRVRFTDAE
jgi:hypothetical protein